MLILAILVAGQALEFPPDFKGEPGQFVTIKPTKTEGKMVQYYAIDPGLSVFPAALLVDPTATVVSAVQPGHYRLLAWTAVADKPSPPSLIRVSIGKVSPPAPIDPFRMDLESIYAALNEPDKDSTREAMIRVYRACGEKSKSATTVGDLFTKLQGQTQTLPSGKLIPLRKRIGDEVEKVVGNEPETQLTANQQSALADIFYRVCLFLEGVK